MSGTGWTGLLALLWLVDASSTSPKRRGDACRTNCLFAAMMGGESARAGAEPQVGQVSAEHACTEQADARPNPSRRRLCGRIVSSRRCRTTISVVTPDRTRTAGHVPSPNSTSREWTESERQAKPEPLALAEVPASANCETGDMTITWLLVDPASTVQTL